MTGPLPPRDSGSVTGSVERVEYCWPDVVGVGETAPTPVNVAEVPESAKVPGGTGRMRLARVSIWTSVLKSRLPPARGASLRLCHRRAFGRAVRRLLGVGIGHPYPVAQDVQHGNLPICPVLAVGLEHHVVGIVDLHSEQIGGQ